MPLIRLKKGSHTRYEDGERVTYKSRVRGRDVLEVTDAELKSQSFTTMPGRYEIVHIDNSNDEDDVVDIISMNASEASEFVAKLSSLDDLNAFREVELAQDRPRKTVLTAMDVRENELNQS